MVHTTKIKNLQEIYSFVDFQVSFDQTYAHNSSISLKLVNAPFGMKSS